LFFISLDEIQCSREVKLVSFQRQFIAYSEVKLETYSAY